VSKVPRSPQSGIRRPYLVLLSLTFGALLVHGYHPAVEDGEIYLPGIKKILNPNLYGFGAEFFQNHARMTLFAHMIAASVRISHLSFDVTVFIWYLLSIFMTLLACWDLSSDCFQQSEARWAGVGMIAALLTLPVAGTALYIADPYLTPRSIAMFALLFAIRNAVHGRYVRFIAWSIFAAAIHPLMAAFGVSLGLLLLRIAEWPDSLWKQSRRIWTSAALLPLFPAASDAYHEAVHTRSYFFILEWRWYEWLGIVAPLALFWWFNRWAHRNKGFTLERISRSLIVYGCVYFVAALALTIPSSFETLARLQPMRSLHLLYTFLVLAGGGLIGLYILKKRVWLWAILFVSLSTGMYFAQRHLYPHSSHIEWPGSAPSNDWLRAFEWIRTYTPANAVFAVNPYYMLNDDQHGFRAIAERSRLADAVKDAGAVTMFPDPPLAEHWVEQTADEKDWPTFQASDLHRLKEKYGVTWAVVDSSIRGLACPYRNPTVRVCHVD